MPTTAPWPITAYAYDCDRIWRARGAEAGLHAIDLERAQRWSRAFDRAIEKPADSVRVQDQGPWADDL